jgi:(2Fe-2S) ferredoxin
MPIPEKHVLVCTGDDCRKRGGRKLCRAFKEALAEAGLKRRVKVVEVDCFDQCAHGPIALVYPDAVWYAHLEAGEAEEVVRVHLVSGRPLARRLYRRAHPPAEQEAGGDR